MTERHTRRTFFRRNVGFATGLAVLPLLSNAFRPPVARAHNVGENAARASELYVAMQKNFYLSDSKLYLETSPRARSNPYAYLWPFYEAMSGTIDLVGKSADVNDRLAGLARYYRGQGQGYDSYPRNDGYGAGGDRYYDDNAWVARAFIQLHRLDKVAFPSALASAQDVYTFLKTGRAADGAMYWVKDGGWNADRGTGPTGGFAKVALHLSDPALTGQKEPFTLGKESYKWVRDNLLTKDGSPEYVGKLYWDKILGNGGVDTRYWSYNQGVMIGAGVLLARLAPKHEPNDPGLRTYLQLKPDQSLLKLTMDTADTAITYYNSVGWYSQPVIFNSLFFRNLLLLCGEIKTADPTRYDSYLGAAQSFADKVWDNPRIHNMQKHMIKFDERTSAYKLREQAGMVQLFACLAWAKADKDVMVLA